MDVTSPSASNSAIAAEVRRVVVLGNPGGRRLSLFGEALARLGLPPARVVSYGDLIAGRAHLAGLIDAGTLLRVESPDRDFEAERGLLALGADEPDDEHDPTRIGREAALQLEFERGRLLYPRQWFLGFRAFLRRVEAQRAECPPHLLMNQPADIAVMFDKVLCHRAFHDAGIPIPRGLGIPSGYDELRVRMRAEGIRRVFVKLAHGSSASGVVALETDGSRLQAFTTVEMVRTARELRLYNTRAIRRYTSESDVALLIDVLGRERIHAEQWFPKAGLSGGAFDLRVVVIAGRAAHVVARVGQGPLTNLHLLNRRGDLDTLRTRMPLGAWGSALQTCERAAGCFPGSLYAGVDLAIAPDDRRHAVLEINAFGDLLPGIEHRGMDTYEAELVAATGAQGNRNLSTDDADDRGLN